MQVLRERTRHRSERPTLRLLMAGVCALGGLAAGLVQAQTPPDAGSVLRELERAQRAAPSAPPAAPAPSAPTPAKASAPAATSAPAAPGSEVRFVVRSFALQGVSLVPQDAVQAVLAPWLHRPIDFAELEKALEAVASFYQAQGWLARAQLPVQSLDETAEVRIEVLEARIGQTQLAVQPAEGQGEAPTRLPAQRLQRLLVEQMPTGSPLRLADYERAMGLLNDTPGVNATASLAVSDTPGATDVIVSAQDKGRGSAAILYDNGGSRSTGADRLNAQFSLDNPLRLGDQLMLGLMATEGVNYQRLAYTLPVGLQGWRVGVQAAQMRYRMLGAFSASGAYGDTQVMGANASWPWRRGAQGNASLALSAERKQFRNVVPALSDARKTMNNLQAGLSGDRSDTLGDGGIAYWSLNLTAGQLSLASEADRTQDQAGPQTEGRFAKVGASASRLQRLGSSHALWLAWNGQRASRNLDSSEKFSLGGPQGVRAYPASEATGDHGWLATAEWRYTVSAQWQWLGFYDHGGVRVQHSPFGPPAATPGQFELRGVGMALAWMPSARASVRLTLARRLGTNPLANASTGADSDGSLRRNRLWLNATLSF